MGHCARLSGRRGLPLQRSDEDAGAWRTHHEHQIKLCGTKGCPAWFGQAEVHSTECRARFEALLALEDPAAATAEEPAAGKAQASSSSSATAGVPDGSTTPDFPWTRVALRHVLQTDPVIGFITHRLVRSAGQTRCKVQRASGFSTACHGEDFFAEGSAAALDHLDRVVAEAFDVKVLPKIRPPVLGGQAVEGNHLGRTIAWTPRLGAATHNTSSRSCTPASKATGKNMRNVMDELPNERAELLKRAAGDSLAHCHRQAIRAVCNARNHVWHVQAFCDALGEASPPGQVRAAIPRGTLRHEHQRTPEMLEVQGSGDADRITVASGQQFEQRCNAVETKESPGAWPARVMSARLLSLHSAGPMVDAGTPRGARLWRGAGTQGMFGKF